MPHDSPAALPLFAYAAALALGGSYRDACGIAAVAILLVALKKPRAAVVTFAFAAGLFVAAHRAAVKAADDAVLAMIDPVRFVTVEAPLESDWLTRGDHTVLRVDEFRVDGIAIHRPLLIYARFQPAPIGMATTIRAEGFLRDNLTVKSPRLISYRGELPRWNPRRWNRELVARVRPLAAQHPVEEALVEAVALGRAERLDDATRNDYKRGGTYHLLVFSGLQITIAAGFIALLLRWLHAPRTSDWSLLIFAILAPLFIGPSASVSRASIGVGVYAVARILRRPTTLENLWCVAALLRLIVSPEDLTNVAFHLTYAGAGALLFVGKRRWYLAAAAAELAVTPLTLFHFHQYALGGSIMTVLLTPLVTAMLVVALVTCAVPSAHVLALLGAIHQLCSFLNRLAAPISGFFAAPPVLAMAIGFGLALLAIALLRGNWRTATVAAALAIPTVAALYLGTRTPEGTRLTMLDVGQGDAILYRSGGKTILVDGGPRPLTLLPLLADRGVRRIDVVVLSHVHPDHCSGLPVLVAQMRVGEVWISPRRFKGDCAQALLEACRTALVPIHFVRDGDTKFGMKAFVADHTFRHAPENNASVVLQIGPVLLTGDIEHEAEAELAPRLHHADILKIAHHGSRSSTTPPLLDAVRPRIALISCGRHNIFGHPHPEVLEALRARGIRVWRTDRDGSVEIEIR
ncbi:MAG TPA: DNA internalization-related competence protein ComEC/Rec2 [Thermoanaerobaculia bacterium]|nr:DNA internalization-related competence protein ComEC/Rec2 [Thermoanaerobaculia bacterium]